MKKSSITAWLLGNALSLLVLSGSVTASFERDVVMASSTNIFNILKIERMKTDLNDELLSKSMPLKEYEAQLKAKGQYIAQTTRNLQEEDDFYMDDDAMYSFSGYSIKYAKCQPVQYFSENAVAAGEHSPMVTQDIVILRLCPQKSCSTSVQYGCHYNYAEYAIALSDYLGVMLRYSAKRLEKTCEWCETCQGNGGRRDRYRKQRRLDEAAADDYAEVANDDDELYQAGIANCPYYATYCTNYTQECNMEENDDAYITFMDYEEIFEKGYLQCSQAQYNNYAYFVRPRCDGYDGTIKMAVFYDQFCVSYAGSDVSIKDMGLGFHEGIFEEYYSGSCIDCTQQDDDTQPPNFDTNSALCNKIHFNSAKCTADMAYSLFDGYEDSSSECSYIESIRFGTYDESGKLSSASVTSGVTWTTEVSFDQKIVLAFSVAICIFLIFYACYIHHSMTNLLIKSLSHRELLPPSRHRAQKASMSVRGRNTAGSVRSSSRHNDDWEKPQIV